jgi:hypothetical protein
MWRLELQFCCSRRACWRDLHPTSTTRSCHVRQQNPATRTQSFAECGPASIKREFSSGYHWRFINIACKQFRDHRRARQSIDRDQFLDSAFFCPFDE